MEMAGKKVGLITNHTAVVEGRHLIDIITSDRKVNLSALFGPEHGLRGTGEDGETIGDYTDPASGAKVYSLYGAFKKPTPGMLHGLDYLLFDIQDVGARFYTFISTMGLAMQAAAEARIPFVVLDRPNPLGGEYVAGPPVEEGFRSFVGKYPIPVAHGMTVAELALMIKGEKMLPGLEELDLRIVRMQGWHRWMQWPDTGLGWIRTSPNIPDFETALLYPGICFFEATSASEGRGTDTPFKVVGFPGLDGTELAEALNHKGLAGVRFEPVEFTPESLPGTSSRPKFRNRTIAGVRIVVTDRGSFRPVEAAVHLLSALYQRVDERARGSFFRNAGFDHLAGSESLRRSLKAGKDPDEIVAGWEEGLRRFEELRRKYLIY
jgi:uncharacterized protein YbbC (DUF1343 family)